MWMDVLQISEKRKKKKIGHDKMFLIIYTMIIDIWSSSA